MLTDLAADMELDFSQPENGGNQTDHAPSTSGLPAITLTGPGHADTRHDLGRPRVRTRSCPLCATAISCLNDEDLLAHVEKYHVRTGHLVPWAMLSV